MAKLDTKRGELELQRRIAEARSMHAIHLDLAGLALTKLPSEIGSLTALQSLDINSNQLSELPPEIESLTALQYLDAGSNQLTRLPPEIGSLAVLRTLLLNSNQLVTLPAEIGSLTSLTSLALYNNQLSELPSEIGSLLSLRNLWIDDNRLTELPPEIGLLTTLDELLCGGNPFTVLPPEISLLTRLRSLFLDSKGYTAFPREICSLTSLQELSLYDNQLTSLPPDIAAFTDLHTLYLNSNHLTALPQEIGSLAALRSLHLSNNHLVALPQELHRLSSLRELFLHGNPELGLPPEILGPAVEEVIRNGMDATPAQQIIAYYLARTSESGKPLNEARILVVGEPGVGKTVLIEWLVKNQFKKNAQWTKGIKVVPWKIPGDGEGIKVNIWDFGGQEIMQATHQFFLTDRSLYLLIIDSRENEEQSKTRYWLDKIRAFGADSPVVVVLNKRDEGQYEPDENRLKLDYPKNLHDDCFMRAACKTGNGVNAGAGIGQLRECVASRIRNLENVKQSVPTNYLKAKDAFEKKSRAMKRMDRKDFNEICRKCGLKEDVHRDTLLSYLKSLGSLFHYPRRDDVEKTLVLDPEWLTGGVYKILTDAVVRENGGILRPADLSRIFGRSKTYDNDSRRFILEMMEGHPFDLSFRIPDTNNHRLIPELLPPNEPPHGISPQTSLNIEYHYKFLPGGLIPRFIVRMHNVLSAGDAWRNGVVLNVDGRRVLVRGVREKGRVYISAEHREPAARRALAIVRQNLVMVHRAMSHVEWTEHVALPDNPDVTIAYQDLLQYEKDEGSAYSFRPQAASRKYTVRELLDGIEESIWRITDEPRGKERRDDAFHSESIDFHEMKELGVTTGQIFVSYANEPDPNHARVVRDLADKLRLQGVNALVDQYLDEMGPDVDWPLWMKRQVETSSVVLMVCSPAYRRRVEGNEAPGRGLGATYEGKLVRQEMYNNGVVNKKYRPILLDLTHVDSIPLDLQGTNHFKLYEPGGYDRLYRALTGQPSVIAPPLGKPIVMPPKP